jgi:glycosyltransferase involved in cell wall biosynthesis
MTPDIVILDEPVHDRTQSHQVLLAAVLADLHARGLTTHVVAPAWWIPGRRGTLMHLLVSAIARQVRYPLFARRRFRDGRVTLLISAGLGQCLWLCPAGSRVAVICHDAIPYLPAQVVGHRHDFGGSLRHHWLRLVQGRALRRAALVFAPSRRTRDDLVTLGLVDPAHVQIRRHRVDPAIFSPGDRATARAALGWPQHDIILLAVVNTERRKNVPRLLAAFAELRRGHPGIRLALLGPIATDALSPLEELRAGSVASTGAPPAEPDAQVESDAIIRLGPLDVRYVAHAYVAANCLVHVSLYEGFGYPLLEAMSSACPIVAADRGATVEVAGTAAVYVDPFDPIAIADGVDIILSDAVRRNACITDGLRRAAAFTGDSGYGEALQELAGM